MKPTLLLLALTAALAAQTIDGDIVDLTDAPVPGAYVIIRTLVGNDPSIVVTNSAGHFHLLLPAPRIVSIQVTRTGYLDRQQMISGGPTPSAYNVKVVLTPQAVIAGKIVDDDGFPAAGANVEALYFALIDGERKLKPVMTGGIISSDDEGRYRIAKLPPGAYYIRATPHQIFTWDPRYAPEFYPGVTSLADTKMIEVAVGQERSGVDFRLTRQEGVTVSGRIDRPAGSEVRPVQLTTPDNLAGVSRSQFVTAGDGSFSLHHVPPGSYILRVPARSMPPAPGDLMAEHPLEVGDSDIRDIVLTPRTIEPQDVSGAVTLEGGGQPPTVAVGLHPDVGSTITVRSSEDGSFTLKNVPPGHYNLTLMQESAHPGLVRSVHFGDKPVSGSGIDITDAPVGPLRIAISTRIARLAGSLLDTAGNPHGGPMIVLMSIPPANRQMVFTDLAGAFTFSGVPGDYHVYVFDDQGPSTLLDDADYLEKHQNDFPVLHLVEGKNPPLTLRMPR